MVKNTKMKTTKTKEKRKERQDMNRRSLDTVRERERAIV